MAAHSNLAEHLLECLNVVCGRCARAGDPVANPGVLGPRRSRKAQVVAGQRPWEQGWRSHAGGFGLIFGERMSGNLANEILEPGPGQVRALIVDAGNPALALPDRDRTARALDSLDLLVCIEPFLTATARRAHYILPPRMMLERPDLPNRDYETIVLGQPYAHYTPALLEPPSGAELVDDWYVFWALARRMGVPLCFDGVALDMERAPTSDALLALLARNSQVPFEELRREPGGRIHAVPAQSVEPADAGAQGRFDVMPADVADELRAVLDEFPGDATDLESGRGLRLCVRRARDVQNTMFHDLPAVRRRHAYNPAWMNPDDLARLGLAEGDRVRLSSENGKVAAIVRTDKTLRPGVVAMWHGWGGGPREDAEYEDGGANTNRLVSLRAGRECINAMPVMNAIPVRVERDPEEPRPCDATTSC